MTHAAVNPFFRKLNTDVGEIARSNRMLLYLLPLTKDQPGLMLNAPFWNKSDASIKMIDNKLTCFSNRKVLKMKRPEYVIGRSVVRPSMGDYRIVDEPIDSFSE